MPKYTCERCLKEFSQKSHFDKHQNKKMHTHKVASSITSIVEFDRSVIFGLHATGRRMEDKAIQQNIKRMINEHFLFI